MSVQIMFHEGALVKCPVCLSEVHCSEIGEPNDRPFRCVTCRRRMSERYQQLEVSLTEEEKRGAQEGKSDDHSEGQSVDLGRAKRRSEKAQQQPA